MLVDQDSYLPDLLRYIVLNPVRARKSKMASEWPWSSFQAVMGKASGASALAIYETPALFSTDRGTARRAYARFCHVSGRAVPARRNTYLTMTGVRDTPPTRLRAEHSSYGA